MPFSAPSSTAYYRTLTVVIAEALRRSEPRNPERLAEIVGVLRHHELFAEWEEVVLEKIAQAMREQGVREPETLYVTIIKPMST